MNLSIYDYEDPSQFLNDSWEQKKSKNAHFTIRSWAKQLGVNSHGTLYDIVKGKRHLPKKYFLSVCRSLKLNTKESLYLETMIELKKAKSEKVKVYYKQRLTEISPKKSLNYYEIESFHFLKNPLHMAIIELTTLNDFQSDIDWI